MKKLFVALFTFVLFFGLFVGQASASTDITTFAKGLIGVKYQYGGSTTKGFDCSGFTSYVMKQFDVDLHRSSRDQYKQGEKVKKSELRLGDLVFFNTSGKGVSHVGIYLSDNKFIHASTSDGVRIDDLDARYYANRYVGATRVMTEEQYKAAKAQQ